jgi:battenin
MFGAQGMVGALLMIALEGLSGGLSYVSVFYRLGQEDSSEDADLDPTARLARREFKMACMFAALSLIFWGV